MMTISKDWIEWCGGKCPVHGDTQVEVTLRDGSKGIDRAGDLIWKSDDGFGDIIAYRIATHEPKANGGKLSGDHYYRVSVSKPIAPDVQPYVAECADIIEALNMTFNEGEAFKAIWRLAASRQGRVKPGSAGMQYDADKVGHYGVRVAEHTRSQE